MSLTNEKNAVFSESGNRRVINFKFTSTVKVKEEGNCGNHRGITCPFRFHFQKRNQKPNQINYLESIIHAVISFIFTIYV
jgi:hypothetical protein